MWRKWEQVGNSELLGRQPWQCTRICKNFMLNGALEKDILKCKQCKNVMLSVATLWTCKHVHCLCICIRSHVSKFQHRIITSNDFTACWVSDTTCVLWILLCGNVHLWQLSSQNNVPARPVATLWFCNLVHRLLIKTQILFCKLNCNSCVLQHNRILNTRVVTLLTQGVKWLYVIVWCWNSLTWHRIYIQRHNTGYWSPV